MEILDVSECISLYLDLLKIVAPSMIPAVEAMFDSFSDEEVIDYFCNITCSDKSFYLIIEPMTENMTIDKVNQLYETFSWIKPEPMLMPVQNSRGEIRYVPSRRPLVYGYQYIYRLKQYAEEKFSVTSLSATNIRNENSKSKSSNNYKALYSRTPIRFGDMETGNLIHLGAELVVQMLMLYSTSPNARRLTSSMLTDDPFNIDVKLDMESKNRNAEILNVYFKTMGLKMTFTKIPKKKELLMDFSPMIFYDGPNRGNLIDPMIIFNKDEKVDLEYWFERGRKNIEHTDPMDIYLMEFYEKTEDSNKDECEEESSK